MFRNLLLAGAFACASFAVSAQECIPLDVALTALEQGGAEILESVRVPNLNDTSMIFFADDGIVFAMPVVGDCAVNLALKLGPYVEEEEA